MNRYEIAGVVVQMTEAVRTAWENGTYRRGMVVEAMPGKDGWQRGTFATLPKKVQDRMAGYPANRC